MNALSRWFTRLRPRTRILLAVCAVLFALGIGLSVWLLHDLPPIDRLYAGLALPSTRIYDRHGRLLYEVLADSAAGGRSSAVPLNVIPPHCQRAVIATEDANFYAHPGVDPVGVARALWINLTGGDVLAGGSTITQQVARMLLFDPEQRAERSIRRKLREMILALQLESAYSKDDVLALYFNQAYFGNLAYGIDAAARAYFSKDTASLSLAECAMLVGLVQSPARYDPLSQPEAARARQSVVLDLMVSSGALTAEAAEIARSEPLRFAAAPFPIEAPHFVMAVITRLQRDYPEQLARDGLEVMTTVDLDWTRAAQSIVQRQLGVLNGRTGRPPANAENAALVAIDPRTGEVLTLLGSPDYFNAAIDGAVNAAFALRQPGSALKPITYAAAMHPARPEPYTAATLFLDVATPFVTRRLESYTPSNYALVEHGPVLLREALASSFNIPAVVALDDIGISTMLALAVDLGLGTLANRDDLDLALTLGGGEVRLFDLVGAYGVFANGGCRVEPALITRVATSGGEVLYQWQPPAPCSAGGRGQIVDPRVAWLISDMLSDDQARLRSFGRFSALAIGRPAAVKTGTTTDFRDNWVVGYTPELAVGVWVGNADNTPMVEVTGVSGAAPIWNSFMRTALRGTPESPFIMPPGITRRTICALSGRLATPLCPRQRSEWFIEGTEPRAFDDMYQVFEIDRETGLLADDSTPPAQRVARTFAVLPQEARDWGIRHGFPPPPAAAQVVQTDLREGVRALAPDPYTIFELTPLIPRSAQRIRLSAAVPPGVTRVDWLLNDTAIGTADAAPWTMWWALEEGAHTLIARATFPDGTTQDLSLIHI
jgi:penicillin-binding protein 1C